MNTEQTIKAQDQTIPLVADNTVENNIPASESILSAETTNNAAINQLADKSQIIEEGIINNPNANEADKAEVQNINRETEQTALSLKEEAQEKINALSNERKEHSIDEDKETSEIEKQKNTLFAKSEAQYNNSKKNSSENQKQQAFFEKVDALGSTSLFNSITVDPTDFKKVEFKYGVTKQEFIKTSLPEMYKQKKVSSQEYKNFLTQDVFNGNSLKYNEIDFFVQNTPADILKNLVKEDPKGVLSQAIQAMNEQYGNQVAKISKELESEGDWVDSNNVIKGLNYVASAGRFIEKSQIQGYVDKFAEKLPYEGNISNIRFDNLYEAGFGNIAKSILIKGLEKKLIGFPKLFELKDRGFISEEEIKDILYNQENGIKEEDNIENVSEEANTESGKIENDTQNKITQLSENKESKEGLPENHIMNPVMLDKIAKLEAIDWDTLEFSQDKYDDYMNSQAKLGSYSVGSNQKKIQEALNSGKTMNRARDLETIYGIGGVNRYGINTNTGEVTLLRGPSNTSGSEKYKTILAAKTKELGLNVENS